MRVLQIEIENFRGIASGRVTCPEHALFVGPNNGCKSTILEALDLALGVERLGGPDAIDEHDFHKGIYRASKREPEAQGAEIAGAVSVPEIRIVVTLGGLEDDELTRFREHVELWNDAERRPCTPEEAEAVEAAAQRFVLRILFVGRYDSDEDQFEAETVFVNPEYHDGSRDRVGKKHKREIGFLYLRSLRTGRRAASMQRGSLLDVLMNLADAKPRFWQGLIDGLGDLGEKASADSGVRAILDELEGRLGTFLRRPARGTAPVSRLNVGTLTREHLRALMTFFLTSYESGHLLPFDRLGSGTTNVLVLALLTLIAERKQNVIFAMEEPEIAIGPTVQRRIITRLKEISSQALLTSHSPYVAEQMLPDQIVVLRRASDGSVSSATATATPELKEKILRMDFRQRYAEGLLGNAVLIVEGVTEVYALPVASNVLGKIEGTAYRPLDLLGVIPVPAKSDGELAQVASFFAGAGIDTYVFCDTLNDTATRAAVVRVAKDVHEHPYSGFERVISEELADGDVRRILKLLASRVDYPAEVSLPGDIDGADAWKEALYKALKKRKGEGYCAIALGECSPTQLPVSLRRYLIALHVLASGTVLPETDPVHRLTA